MTYQSFTSNLTYNVSMSGQVQFFTNPTNAAAANGANVSLNSFQQMFQPTLANSTAAGLGITSAPAAEQDAVRALYDQQVDRLDDERIYRRTTSSVVAMRGCCRVKTEQGDLYYVPADRQREFSDFAHRVSCYKAAPASQPGAATRPAASLPGGPRGGEGNHAGTQRRRTE